MLLRMRSLSPVQISVIAHLFVGVLIFILTLDLSIFKSSKKVDFKVIVNAVIAPSNLALQPKNETKPVQPEKIVPENSQKVFGVSRKAITTSNPDAASVKQGNTITKENDDLKLKDTDEDSLPIPADDYRITKDVSFLYKAKMVRTDQARAVGYVGTARVSILVDQLGNVRDIKLLNDLPYGLNERAIECIKMSKFAPAEIDGIAVVTRRTISINFKTTD